MIIALVYQPVQLSRYEIEAVRYVELVHDGMKQMGHIGVICDEPMRAPALMGEVKCQQLEEVFDQGDLLLLQSDDAIRFAEVEKVIRDGKPHFVWAETQVPVSTIYGYYKSWDRMCSQSMGYTLIRDQHGIDRMYLFNHAKGNWGDQVQLIFHDQFVEKGAWVHAAGGIRITGNHVTTSLDSGHYRFNKDEQGMPNLAVANFFAGSGLEHQYALSIEPVTAKIIFDQCINEGKLQMQAIGEWLDIYEQNPTPAAIKLLRSVFIEAREGVTLWDKLQGKHQDVIDRLVNLSISPDIEQKVSDDRPKDPTQDMSLGS